MPIATPTRAVRYRETGATHRFTYGLFRVVVRYGDWDEATITIRCRTPRWVQRRIGSRRAIARLLAVVLTEAGLLRSTRCDCSHCRADRDCCGRWVGYAPRFAFDRRGVTVTQHVGRNV